MQYSLGVGLTNTIYRAMDSRLELLESISRSYTSSTTLLLPGARGRHGNAM